MCERERDCVCERESEREREKERAREGAREGERGRDRKVEWLFVDTV